LKKKHSDINFRENPFSGSRIVLWGHMDGRTDIQTDSHKKLTVAFHNFSHAKRRQRTRHILPCSCLWLQTKSQDTETYVLQNERSSTYLTLHSTLRTVSTLHSEQYPEHICAVYHNNNEWSFLHITAVAFAPARSADDMDKPISMSF